MRRGSRPSCPADKEQAGSNLKSKSRSTLQGRSRQHTQPMMAVWGHREQETHCASTAVGHQAHSMQALLRLGSVMVPV